MPRRRLYQPPVAIIPVRGSRPALGGRDSRRPESGGGQQALERVELPRAFRNGLRILDAKRVAHPAGLFHLEPQALDAVEVAAEFLRREHLPQLRYETGQGLREHGTFHSGLRETHELLADDIVDQPFGRAFQTFDSAIWAHSAGSAIVTIWAALETLIRPGHHQITKRLASSLAALLEPPGPERDRLFQRLTAMYEARGGSVHTSRPPETQHRLSSFDIARRSFMACMDRRERPNADDLHEMWRLKK